MTEQPFAPARSRVDRVRTPGLDPGGDVLGPGDGRRRSVDARQRDARIAAGLDASQSSQQWIVDAYALMLAALLLPAGALGDRFGRRGALIAGIAIFGIGSRAVGVRRLGRPLIALRALTGLGAALLMPGTLSTITSVFPPEERAKAVGIWAGFAGAGGTLGMLVSGALLEQF